MMFKYNPRQWLAHQLEVNRLHLARPDALLRLAGLGLLTGLIAGAVIVLFRLLVEQTQEMILPGSGAENYEALPLWARFALPILGGLLLAGMFRWGARGLHVLGVARVMERMAYHQGYLTARGFLLQFFGAAIAIISGHSVGREGPHIFLGAAAGSLLAQRLSLPNNTVRTLVGCGTAAGIAASFNTPLAGVIFALEVVMLDYSLASFIPVILSAVSATLISNLVLGKEVAFLVPPMELGSLDEIFLVVLLGFAAGTVSAIFIQLIQTISGHTRNFPIWWRVLFAGLVVGSIGMLVPEVMGIGYDTVNASLLGQYSASFLLLMVVLKLLATSTCISMGIPGGMIGPVLFIGVTLGDAIGELVGMSLFQLNTPPGFFGLLGMAAMMGASLQAPLAALTALLELTHNPQLIMPGMLAVVVAGLTASELFRKESLFITMLKANGMDYQHNPVLQALRRVGVASVMDKHFASGNRFVSREQAKKILKARPAWILVEEENQPIALLRAVDLVSYLESESITQNQEDDMDLMSIPVRDRLQLAPVSLHATLQEALEQLDQGEGEALYVRRMTAPGNWRIYGVLTREHVESAYKY
jgi:CIC family chloride channel protein